MEIKQEFNTFVRNLDGCVYVYNSKTKEDLFIDESGFIFLSQICREWKSLDLIVSGLLNLFNEVDKDELTSDVIEFFGYLNEKGFVEIRQEGVETHTINTTKPHNDYVLSPLVKQVPDTTQVHLLKIFSKSPKLFSLQIELTNLCNERCIHCYIPHKFKTKKMSLSHYKAILEEANKMGVLTLVINGEEPMCHPDFLNMLKMAKKYDFNITILSNLTLMTDEFIDCIKNSHVSEIQTSIYSLDANVHDKITNIKGSLELTLNNLFKLKANGIQVRVSCVLMKQNKDSYKDLLHWSKKYNIPISIDYILFGRYDYTTDNLENRLTKKDIEEIIRYTIENDETYVKKIQSTDFDRLNNYYKQFGISCNVGRSTLCIASDGTAYPCIGWQGYKLGNISELSLMEIWNGVKLEKLRNISRTDFEKCKECKDLFFCSRCLARNANENNGDYMKLSQQTCDLANMNRMLCGELLNVDYQFE